MVYTNNTMLQSCGIYHDIQPVTYLNRKCCTKPDRGIKFFFSSELNPNPNIELVSNELSGDMRGLKTEIQVLDKK